MAEPTAGGKRLRELRERAQKRAGDVEYEANLGYNYLQRIESGRVQRPSKETVESILDALDARFTDRVEVLERFGYVTSIPVPTEEEQAWARAACQPVMDALPFPSYLLDMRSYLISWNHYIPAMLDVDDAQLRDIWKPEYLTLFEGFFDPRLRLVDMMENADAFLSHMIGVMRHDFETFYWEEEWCQPFVEQVMQREPEFKRYWDMDVRPNAGEVSGRPLISLCLHSPTSGRVTFRVTVEFMRRDNRFRIIYLIPADAATIEVCEQWKDRQPPSPEAD